LAGRIEETLNGFLNRRLPGDDRGKLDISIIIISHNSIAELPHCLDSLPHALTGMEWEVVAVDNASGDRSADLLSEHPLCTHLIRNEENRGFGRACNQGFNASTGDNLLFLNPDTQCTPLSLNILMNYLKENPRVGAVGPKLLKENGSVSKSCFRFPTLTRPFLDIPLLRPITGHSLVLHYPPYHSSLTEGGPVDWLSGACLLVRRRAFIDVGGFDERFFMYFEDTDICKRLWDQDWSVIYYPAPAVIHLGGRSTRDQSEDLRIERQRSRVIFLSNQYGPAGQLLNRLLTAAAATFRCLKWILYLKVLCLPTEIRIVRIALGKFSSGSNP